MLITEGYAFWILEISQNRGDRKRNTNAFSNCVSTDWCPQLRAVIARTLTASLAGIGVGTVQVVTERKCGGVDDVTGCTLYNSKISRKVSTL
uniref:Secreted protein n=1 Tax=Angiostrongylus cantonensis TaxID=6313 RepID=A0A0K0CUL3_ANGCA